MEKLFQRRHKNRHKKNEPAKLEWMDFDEEEYDDDEEYYEDDETEDESSSDDFVYGCLCSDTGGMRQPDTGGRAGA